MVRPLLACSLVAALLAPAPARAQPAVPPSGAPAVPPSGAPPAAPVLPQAPGSGGEPPVAAPWSRGAPPLEPLTTTTTRTVDYRWMTAASDVAVIGVFHHHAQQGGHGRRVVTAA